MAAPPASSADPSASAAQVPRLIPPSPPLPHPLNRPPTFASGRPSSPSFPIPRASFPPIRPTGHIRNPTFAAAVAAASQQAQHRVPFAFSDIPPRPTPPPPPPPAPLMQPPRSARPPPPPASSTPRSAPAANPPPKVSAIPAIPSTTENNNNNKDREGVKDEFISTIHGRKVRLSDCGSSSLYALCRSWVRNGVHQDSQPCIGDNVRILPRPLPVSYIEPRPSLTREDDGHENEHIGLGEHLSTQELLQGHVKHAKKVRASFRKEQDLKIERYKRRLALLLPPPTQIVTPDEPNPDWMMP